MTEKIPAQAFEELIEQSVDILTLLDESGVVQYMSPAVERVAGYAPSELEGENIFEYIHPEDQQQALDSFHEIVEADEGYTTAGVEFRFQHTDGSWVWLDSRGSNQMATELDSYAICTRDISQRKAYEQQLKRERDRFERFASVISHDLRNPLNVIQGRLALAQEECGSEHLDAMEASLDRVNEMIDDLLTLARESGTDPNVDAVDLRQLCEGCWETLDTEHATLNIETTHPIVADESQLKRVLENLFRNAIEHGGADVTIMVGELDDGFYVEDDGPGFPEGARDSILEFGYSTKNDGTGFGLSIVDEIVENHGWSLDVTDSEEGGARFEIVGVETRLP